MYQKILKRIKNLPLAGKLLLLHGILLTVACIIVTLALQICLNIYDEKLYEKSLQELDFFVQQVNDCLENIETMSYNIAMNSEIQNRLSALQGLDAETAEYYYELNRLYAPLIFRLGNDPVIKNVIYFDGRGNSIKAGTDCGTIPQWIVDGLLDDAKEAKGACVMRSPTEEYPYLLVARDIRQYHDYSMAYLGSYIFTCDVTNLIEKNIEALTAPNAVLFVYSEDSVVYHGDAENQFIPSAEIGQGYRIESVQGQRYFICYLQAQNGWEYVNVFPYTEIFGQVMQLRYTVMIAFVLVFLLSIWLMQILSNTITKPIKELSQSMRVVETGNFQEAKAILAGEAAEDETGALMQEFTVMLDKIDTLIHENYEKQLVLQDTRYRMLQAQINPHFLYNTLNTVGWMIQAQKNEGAFEMLVDLGMLLRYALNKSPYTTVADEIEMLKSYVAIQKIRYLGKVEFTVSVQGDVVGWIMPRMILQPLVENALYHGLDDIPQGGLIEITACELEESILFTVTDNGKGIPPDRLQSLQNNTFKATGHGIGLQNIRERLEIVFSHSRFAITSHLNHGTVIEIEVPKVTEVFPNAEVVDR